MVDLGISDQLRDADVYAATEREGLENDAMDGLADVSWSFSTLACREKELLQKSMAADVMWCQALGTRSRQGMTSGWKQGGQRDPRVRLYLGRCFVWSIQRHGLWFARDFLAHKSN